MIKIIGCQVHQHSFQIVTNWYDMLSILFWERVPRVQQVLWGQLWQQHLSYCTNLVRALHSHFLNICHVLIFKLHGCRVDWQQTVSLVLTLNMLMFFVFLCNRQEETCMETKQNSLHWSITLEHDLEQRKVKVHQITFLYPSGSGEGGQTLIAVLIAELYFQYSHLSSLVLTSPCPEPSCSAAATALIHQSYDPAKCVWVKHKVRFTANQTKNDFLWPQKKSTFSSLATISDSTAFFILCTSTSSCKRKKVLHTKNCSADGR